MAAVSKKARAVAYQALALAAVAAALWFLISNTAANLEARRIDSGFSFLQREAGFEIGETFFLRYSASDSYLRALAVGLSNTLSVALIGIVGATVLGVLIGLARLAQNGLLRALAAAYVQFLRNVPLLVQLFFWYALISEALPHPRAALEPLPGVFLTNRGIFLPPPGSVPELSGFNFTGGASLTPEFAALGFGLITYPAACIAEIVRAGVLSIERGQFDAAYALGLTRGQTTRRVVLPQALRLIVPPLTSQYLNVTKNSSLAVAIGFPDLVQVFMGTVLNQTGQAIEVVVITMAVYLTISLVTSFVMNIYNRRVAIVER